MRFIAFLLLISFPTVSFGGAEEPLTGWEGFKKSVALFFEPLPKTDTPQDLYQEIKDKWVPDSRLDYQKLVRWVEVYDPSGKVNPDRKVTLAIVGDSYDVFMINTPSSFQGPSFPHHIWDSKGKVSLPSLDSSGCGIPFSLEEREVILDKIQSNFGFKYQPEDLKEATVYSTVQHIYSHEVWKGYRKPGFSGIYLIYDKDENPRMIKTYGLKW